MTLAKNQKRFVQTLELGNMFSLVQAQANAKRSSLRSAVALSFAFDNENPLDKLRREDPHTSPNNTAMP